MLALHAVTMHAHPPALRIHVDPDLACSDRKGGKEGRKEGRDARREGEKEKGIKGEREKGKKGEREEERMREPEKRERKTLK